MSIKMLPNRSSKELPANALEQAIRAFSELNLVLGAEISVEEEEINRMAKISYRRKSLSDDMFAIMAQYPEYRSQRLPLEEVEKDKRFFEFCDQLASLCASWKIRLDREQQVAGAEYYNAMVVFEAEVNYRVAQGDSKAQVVLKQIQALKKTHGVGLKKAATLQKEATPAAG